MNFFVTGGSRGIGGSIVLDAARAGHGVAFTYLSRAEQAADVEQQARQANPGVQVRAYQMDVKQSESVEAVGDRVLEDFDRIDVVVSNAGMNRPNLLVQMTDEEWYEVVATNLTGAFYVARYFLPPMMSQRFGRFILISSLAHRGITGQANYCASKAGLHGLAWAIAKEYGRRGITANVVVPGVFDTDMTRDGLSHRQQGLLDSILPAGADGRTGRAFEARCVPRIGRRRFHQRTGDSGARGARLGAVTPAMNPAGQAARVGIEKIGVYPCSLALSLPALCQARQRDPAEICVPMMLEERSLNPVWEDPVTMGVNAANAILTDDDRRRIELLIVASESGVDYEKPISTWVQRFAGLNQNCRNFEVKHACYGGTAALQMAASWLAAGAPEDAKALIVATDQSRPHFGKPWEFVLGAAAAAVVVSREPRLLEIEIGRSGYWTNEISDLTRPTGAVETGNSETSLVSYLEALEGAFEHFTSRVPEAKRYDEFFQRHVYHMPFGGMAWRAHKTLLRLIDGNLTTKDAWSNFERKGLAAARYTKRMGATYSSSTFIGLLGLLDGTPDAQPGERVSVFSYGSGCCSEFYSARLGDGCPDRFGRRGPPGKAGRTPSRHRRGVRERRAPALRVDRLWRLRRAHRHARRLVRQVLQRARAPDLPRHVGFLSSVRMELTGAAVVRLPAVLNRSSVQDLRHALDEAAAAADAGRLPVVLVGHDDDLFCEGMDIAAASAEDEPADVLHNFAACLQTLRFGRAPALCVVRGKASGGGVGLAAACDGVLASPEASFGLPELLFGLTPAIILPYLLERMPPQKVRWMALTSQRLTADEALRAGLVDAVERADAGPRVLRSWIRRLQRVGRDTVSIWKRACVGSEQDSKRLDSAAQGVNMTLARLRDPDVRDRIRAFADEGDLPWVDNDR